MRPVLCLVGISMLVFGACGGGDDTGSGATGSSSSQPEGGSSEATVSLADSDLGDIVVDGEGRTLYMFVPDQRENGTPSCYEDCAQAWPPLESSGEPTGGDEVDQSLLGTIERTDGASQVTYNDLPLYHYSGDEAAGDTTGQGLSDFWWVVGADGKPIKDVKESSGSGSRPGY